MLKPAVITAKRSKTWMSKVKNVLSALLDKVQGILCISGDARRICPQSLSVNLGEKKIHYHSFSALIFFFLSTVTLVLLAFICAPQGAGWIKQLEF